MLPHLHPALARLVDGTSFVVLFWGVVLEKWAMVLLVVALVCFQVVVLEELAAVGGLGLVVSSFGMRLVQREAGVHRPTRATLVGGISCVVLVWGVVLEEWGVVASVGVLVGLQEVVPEEWAVVGGLGLAVFAVGVISAWLEACGHP